MGGISVVSLPEHKKAALVTGGAKRIGRGVCLHLADMGYDIALHYFGSRADAEKTAGLIRQKGLCCELFRADLSKPHNAEKLLERAHVKFGSFSVLVNNASVFEKASFMEVTERMFEDDMAVNFKAHFFTSQTFARLNRKGLIVNIIDSRVSKNHTLHFTYNLSKKCLYHFTFAAAKALAPSIRVNAICPGPIMKAEADDKASFRKTALETPLKKTGDVKHINLALEYLVNNPFVTGEALFVDGGQHL